LDKDYFHSKIKKTKKKLPLAVGKSLFIVAGKLPGGKGPGGAGRQLAEHDPAVCPGGQEGQMASWLVSEIVWPAGLWK